MRLYRMKRFPAAWNVYDGYEISGLDGFDVRNLAAKEIRWAVYWYGYGSYEGSGVLLGRREKDWIVLDLGHCSCYGPTDKEGDEWPSLEAIEAGKTRDGLYEMRELMLAAPMIDAGGIPDPELFEAQDVKGQR